MNVLGNLPKGADLPPTLWRHTNGNIYRVVGYANVYTEQPDKYPVSVIYEGENGRVWVRPLSDWHRSMTPIDTCLD